jgi:hypothetical protein
MAFDWFPEMTLREADVKPPIVVKAAPKFTSMPNPAFGMADSPFEEVPTKFPAILL